MRRWDWITEPSRLPEPTPCNVRAPASWFLCPLGCYPEWKRLLGKRERPLWQLVQNRLHSLAQVLMGTTPPTDQLPTTGLSAQAQCWGPHTPIATSLLTAASFRSSHPQGEALWVQYPSLYEQTEGWPRPDFIYSAPPSAGPLCPLAPPALGASKPSLLSGSAKTGRVSFLVHL